MADANQSTTDSLGTSDGSPPDYETLLKTEQERAATLGRENEKLGKDLSSLKGTVRTQRSRDDEFQGQLAGLQKQMSAVAKAMEAGSSEGLGGQIDEINDATGTSVASSRFAARYESLLGDLQDAVGGGDGNAALDLKTATELEDARSLWNEGYTNVELSYSERVDLFQQAIGQAHKAVRLAEQAKAYKSTKASKASDTKGDDHESDASLDTDTGAGASGGADTVKSLLKLDTSTMGLKEKGVYEAKLWKAMTKEDGVFYPGRS